MDLRQCLLTNHDCYKAGQKINPIGIVVHSTGANNKYISRYVQPDDGQLGKNKYNNDWNRPGINKCVNAFVGLDKNDKVCIYQTLPWDMRPWGCGKGNNGSYNNTHIQFEICEDGLTDPEYFLSVFTQAAELCAYLIKLYPAITLSNVVSHHEAHMQGYASNHGDCDSWQKKFGRNMDWFRDMVKNKMGDVPTPQPTPTEKKVCYVGRVIAQDGLNLRHDPGNSGKIMQCLLDKTYVLVLVDRSDGWCYIKTPDGKSGYVYRKYLFPYTETDFDRRKVIDKTGLNIRSGAGVSNKLLATMPYDATFMVVQANNTWGIVWCGDSIGWASLANAYSVPLK